METCPVSEAAKRQEAAKRLVEPCCRGFGAASSQTGWSHSLWDMLSRASASSSRTCLRPGRPLRFLMRPHYPDLVRRCVLLRSNKLAHKVQLPRGLKFPGSPHLAVGKMKVSAPLRRSRYE
eukprot:3391319-Amphidinium_carterae.1